MSRMVASQRSPHWATCWVSADWMSESINHIRTTAVFRSVAHITFDRTKWSCRFWLQHKEDMYRYMYCKTCRRSWVLNSFFTVSFCKHHNTLLNGKRSYWLVRKLDCPHITISSLMFEKSRWRSFRRVVIHISWTSCISYSKIQW